MLSLKRIILKRGLLINQQRSLNNRIILVEKHLVLIKVFSVSLCWGLIVMRVGAKAFKA